MSRSDFVARVPKRGLQIRATTRLESASLSFRDEFDSRRQSGGGGTEAVVRKIDPLVKLAAGKPDHTALNTVITEWLVPMLVKEFLAEYRQSPEPDSQDMTMGVRGKEDAAKVRIH